MDEFKERLSSLSAEMAELKQKKAKLSSDRDYLLKRKTELAKKLLSFNLKDYDSVLKEISNTEARLTSNIFSIQKLFKEYGDVDSTISVDKKEVVEIVSESKSTGVELFDEI